LTPAGARGYETSIMSPKEAEPEGNGELHYEEVALKSGVYLATWSDPDQGQLGACWGVDDSSPHITRFAYDAFLDVKDYDALPPDDDYVPTLKKLGRVDGYIISHGVMSDDLNLWEEADAMDADIEAYVAYLQVELQACNVVAKGMIPELGDFPRIVIVRHFEPVEGVDSLDVIAKVVAAVAMKEGPMLLMVDPREMPTDQNVSAGKLKGRTHAAVLMQQLGLVRMICSRSLWGWHCREDLGDWHSYHELVVAKNEGMLESVLKGLRVDRE
jgi:hypothetical protein